MSYILEGLEPEPVWLIFEDLTRIPRCSKHEEKVQAYLQQWASEHDIGYKKDETGNVLLTRVAAEGFENVPVLMFQAHQDMVCEKIPESSHDFERDPIPLELKNGTVTAHGTSLGADNGLGMALAMAVLASDGLVGNGRLEALFTVDEEAGFTGVKNLDPSFFTATHMINLDSEEMGVIIVSSAGGGGTTYTIDFRPQSVGSRDALRIEVSGLKGGHSGVDIHLPRYNALKLLAEGLYNLHIEVPLRLIHFEGGTRGNVIPRDAFADILVSSRNSEKAMEIIRDWANKLDRSHEEDLEVKVEPIGPRSAAPIHETEQLIYLVYELPYGPKSWSSDYEDLVQTSNNPAIAETEDNTFTIQVSSRTSDVKDGYENQRILSELGEKYMVNTRQRELSSGWKADPESGLLNLVKNEYRDALGSEPEVTGIHGGLECGVIAGLKQSMSIVSVGPTIKYPHSPSEYVEIKGVDKLYRTLEMVASRMYTLR